MPPPNFVSNFGSIFAHSGASMDVPYEISSPPKTSKNLSQHPMDFNTCTYNISKASVRHVFV